MSFTRDMMPAWELRAALDASEAEITRLRAEVASKNAALRAWENAVRVDATMEGPVYMGVSSTLGKQAWELTRAALTSQEKTDGK